MNSNWSELLNLPLMLQPLFGSTVMDNEPPIAFPKTQVTRNWYEIIPNILYDFWI